jgi:hypothetical protein
MKRYTLAEIRAANQAAGGHMFDRQTLKFFGETMRNYRVNHDGERVIVIRRGGKAGDGRFEFDPQTGDVRKVAHA